MSEAGQFDRFDLYEMAAQAPEMEARFLRALHRGSPTLLAEDFCGSGAICRAWVALGEGNRAVCVDHDGEALDALRARCAPELLPRLTIRRADVMEADDPADVICALNFPVCYFRTRPELVEYFSHARERLLARGEGGVFCCDVYGGMHAFDIGTSEEEFRDGVRYVWEQKESDPLTGLVSTAMHFRLPDGTLVRDAFTYFWRLWSVPELRDAMAEAGFRSTEVYDRLADAIDGEGNLYIDPITDPDELEDDFVVYVVARA